MNAPEPKTDCVYIWIYLVRNLGLWLLALLWETNAFIYFFYCICCGLSVLADPRFEK